MKYLMTLLLALLLAGCATSTINNRADTSLAVQSNWGVVPFFNHTSVPLAANKVRSMAMALLMTRGVNNVYIYPQATSCNQLVPCANPVPNARKLQRWVKKNNIQYLVAGSVNEWRYKVGLDGEPSVSVVLQVMNASSGAVYWTGVGSKVGNSWSGLGNIAQRLIGGMVARIPLTASFDNTYYAG